MWYSYGDYIRKCRKRLPVGLDNPGTFIYNMSCKSVGCNELRDTEQGTRQGVPRGTFTSRIFKRFPDDKAAEEWFIKQRWPEEVCCVHCGSTNVQTGAKHPSMPYRCRDCGKRFSVRVGTVMQSSKLGYQTWLLATYLLTTSLKSVSSMKLHRDLDVTQKTAWHLAHRIRKGLNLTGMALFSGPVEADEAYLGGKRKHMPKAKRAKLEGRGAVGKTAVAAVKDRPSNQVSARVVPDTKSETLSRFVLEHVGEDAKIYTDDSTSYGRLVHHETVRHSLQEYVKRHTATPTEPNHSGPC